MKRPSAFFIGLTLPILLNACAPFSPSDKRAGVCNELNSQMIFSGNTSNKRTADIQNANQALTQRTYDNNQCDVPGRKHHPF